MRRPLLLLSHWKWCQPPGRSDTPMIESILLTAARVCTFEQQRLLTNASGFFFERDERNRLRCSPRATRS